VNFFLPLTYPIIGQFQNWDDQSYAQYQQLYVALVSTNIALDTLCMIWGIFKLLQRYKLGYLMLNITSICITSELLCCLFRWISSIFNLSNYACWTDYSKVLLFNNLYIGVYYMQLPFTLAAGIFLIFFWLDITSSSLYHGAFLDKAFWPAIILVTICFFLVDISAILVIIGLRSPIKEYPTYFIMGLLVIISFIYFYAAVRVKQYIQKRKDPPKAKDWNRMIMEIVLSGVVMIVIVLVSISQLFFYGPLHSLPWFFSRALFSLRTFLLIDIFGDPPKSATKSTKSTKSNSHPAQSAPPSEAETEL